MDKMQNQHRPNNNGQSIQTIIIRQERPQSNGFGTAGFIMALLGMFLSWVPGIGWILWFLGFIFSVIGLFGHPKGLAITGFIISIIDFVILIALIGFFFVSGM
ncbi:MAG: hypothetical protein IJ845_03725 [Bacteroidaceae bacterium]|nr:hypothetical protein [Bacteroidaceae bacterium]